MSELVSDSDGISTGNSNDALEMSRSNIGSAVECGNGCSSKLRLQIRRTGTSDYHDMGSSPLVAALLENTREDLTGEVVCVHNLFSIVCALACPKYALTVSSRVHCRCFRMA